LSFVVIIAGIAIIVIITGVIIVVVIYLKRRDKSVLEDHKDFDTSTSTGEGNIYKFLFSNNSLSFKNQTNERISCN